VAHLLMDLEVAPRTSTAIPARLPTLEAAMALRVVLALRPTAQRVVRYLLRPSAPVASCLAPAMVLAWIHEARTAHPPAPRQEAAAKGTKALTKVDTKAEVEAEVALEQGAEEVMLASGRRSNRVTATVVLAQHWGHVMVFQLAQVALRSGRPNRHVMGGKGAIPKSSMMRRPSSGRRNRKRGSTNSLHWVWLRLQHAEARISWIPGRSPARPGKA